MNDAISRDDYAAQLNTTFDAYLAKGKSTPLELIEVTEMKVSGNRERFSLVFLGPLNGPVTQETLAVHHATLGSMEIGLQAIAQELEGIQYQAIFNRRIDE